MATGVPACYAPEQIAGLLTAYLPVADQLGVTKPAPRGWWRRLLDALVGRAV